MLERQSEFAYVILGIDENEHDQVISVFKTYKDAKLFCTQTLMRSNFYDVWIEKHLLG